MKETINKTQFVSRFADMNREDNFSREGRELLFDWLEWMEEARGEEFELDVIALCCEFAESDLDEINQDYSQSFDDIDDAVEWLSVEKCVVGVTGDDTIVYQQF